MKHSRLVQLSIPLAFATGCTTGPVTGQLGDPGVALPFSGYTEAKGALITTHVLNNPGDSLANATFTKIGSGIGSVLPQSLNDPQPAYPWSVSARALTQTEWPRGGVVRLKAMRGTSDLATFDAAGLSCAFSKVQAGMSWITAGQACSSPYPNPSLITMVSASTDPSRDITPPFYLGIRSGVPTYPGLLSPSDREPTSAHYYDMIAASPTLTQFKIDYGFQTGNVIRAVYYNHGDLGLARDMNCVATTINSKAVTACYVSNYGRQPGGKFAPAGFGADDLDPQIALGQALGVQGTATIPIPSSANVPIATVAMVYNAALPAGARVEFIVYDAQGNLTTEAALDHGGLFALGAQQTPTTANIAVPDNCLTCHGGSSSYTPSLNGPSVVSNAHFLPFDPAGFEFVTSPSYAAFAKDPTMSKLKVLNAMVWDTQPAPATLALLKGMYLAPPNPQAINLGPKDPASVYNPTFLPAGWTFDPAVDEKKSRAARQVYNEVVKPYCRTCHSSHDAGLLDFLSYDSFLTSSNAIGTMVCVQAGTYPMPQAEQTQVRFWNSPARAHLMSALSIPGTCKP